VSGPTPADAVSSVEFSEVASATYAYVHMLCESPEGVSSHVTRASRHALSARHTVSPSDPPLGPAGASRKSGDLPGPTDALAAWPSPGEAWAPPERILAILAIVNTGSRDLNAHTAQLHIKRPEWCLVPTGRNRRTGCGAYIHRSPRTHPRAPRAAGPSVNCGPSTHPIWADPTPHGVRADVQMVAGVSNMGRRWLGFLQPQHRPDRKLASGLWLDTQRPCGALHDDLFSDLRFRAPR